ncbi:MAG: class I SAM-dependent methyltransferase, partial [Lewinella sp.]|nr:class I SAM-dependent methyltransferase [Lewinella sp.]
MGPALHDLQTVDLAFLDGDHRGAAVLDYAAAIWPHLHADSVLVVSDIHWSAD